MRRALPLFAIGFASLFTTSPASGEESDWDGGWDVEYERRSDFTIGISSGLAVGDVSGYPDDMRKIGDPSQESSTGIGLGGATSIWLGAALRDWFVLAIGLQATNIGGQGLEGKGGALFFRVETYPGFAEGGALQDLALTMDFGAGSSAVFRGEDPLAEGGSQSFIGVGLAYEAWRWGGHVSAGPALQYQTFFSDPLSANILSAAFRVAYYGGP